MNECGDGIKSLRVAANLCQTSNRLVKFNNCLLKSNMAYLKLAALVFTALVAVAWCDVEGTGTSDKLCCI